MVVAALAAVVTAVALGAPFLFAAILAFVAVFSAWAFTRAAASLPAAAFHSVAVVVAGVIVVGSKSDCRAA